MFESTGSPTDLETNTFRLSYKLRERNVQHTKISNIKELAAIFEFGAMLGQGVFGTVKEVKDRLTQKIWAAKIIDKQQAIKLSRGKIIEREIQILKIVHHPHIIYLDKIYETNHKIYLILEKCNVELAIILKEKTTFSELEARKVLQSLSSAITYLHKYDIVHRDLKLENILTAPNPDDSNDLLFIKVTDFGLGIIKAGSKPGDMLKERCGTLTYMAPEIISRSAYTHQCDVWAMGVLTYALLYGVYPFFSTKDTELQRLICSKEPSFTGFTVSPEAIHLLRKMLTKNPALRITASEVERHAWIRGEPMPHESDTDNVLDMMRLWRSEMMVGATSESSLVLTEPLDSNASEESIVQKPAPKSEEFQKTSSKKEQALPLLVQKVHVQSEVRKVEKDGSHSSEIDAAPVVLEDYQAGFYSDIQMMAAISPTSSANTQKKKKAFTKKTMSHEKLPSGKRKRKK